jgi:hypothetical protein
MPDVTKRPFKVNVLELDKNGDIKFNKDGTPKWMELLNL